MSALRAVARHRRRLTSLMHDRCQISGAGDGSVWDPVAEEDVPADGELKVADGRCLVSPIDTAERVVDVGGSPVTLATLAVDLDHAIVIDGQLTIGDRFELTASANPHLLDKRWRIIDVTEGALSPSRRLTVREELRGKP